MERQGAIWYRSIVGGAKGAARERCRMDCKTMSVPEAGRIYYDLGRNGSYEAARRGEIPTIPVGKLLRVPVILMDRKMESAGVSGTPAASRTRITSKPNDPAGESGSNLSLEPAKFPTSKRSSTHSRASASPPARELAVQKRRT